MKIDKRVFLPVVLPLAIAAAAICVWAGKEPVCNGKSVIAYLTGSLSRAYPSEERLGAFISFGTNAIPCLRRAIRARDTTFRRVCLWVARNKSVVKIRLNTAAELHLAGLDRYNHLLEAVDPGLADPSA